MFFLGRCAWWATAWAASSALTLCASATTRGPAAPTTAAGTTAPRAWRWERYSGNNVAPSSRRCGRCTAAEGTLKIYCKESRLHTLFFYRWKLLQQGHQWHCPWSDCMPSVVNRQKCLFTELCISTVCSGVKLLFSFLLQLFFAFKSVQVSFTEFHPELFVTERSRCIPTKFNLFMGLME